MAFQMPAWRAPRSGVSLNYVPMANPIQGQMGTGQTSLASLAALAKMPQMAAAVAPAAAPAAINPVAGMMAPQGNDGIQYAPRYIQDPKTGKWVPVRGSSAMSEGGRAGEHATGGHGFKW